MPANAYTGVLECLARRTEVGENTQGGAHEAYRPIALNNMFHFKKLLIKCVRKLSYTLSE